MLCFFIFDVLICGYSYFGDWIIGFVLFNFYCFVWDFYIWELVCYNLLLYNLFVWFVDCMFVDIIGDMVLIENVWLGIIVGK